MNIFTVQGPRKTQVQRPTTMPVSAHSALRKALRKAKKTPWNATAAETGPTSNVMVYPPMNLKNTVTMKTWTSYV